MLRMLFRRSRALAVAGGLVAAVVAVVAVASTLAAKRPAAMATHAKMSRSRSTSVWCAPGPGVAKPVGWLIVTGRGVTIHGHASMQIGYRVVWLPPDHRPASSLLLNQEATPLCSWARQTLANAVAKSWLDSLESGF